MPKKLTSRKFWLAQQVIYFSVILPILFHGLGISDTVTMASLGVMSGAGALYGAVNVLAKKFAPEAGE